MGIDVVRAEIGQWYMQAGGRDLLHVVGLDDRSHTIEIQSFEGDLDELDVETWRTLHLRRCPDPEGGSGAVDDVETYERCDLMRAGLHEWVSLR